ncbi:MAG: AsmA family protein [Lentisphaeria bacterium]|nr:AsmA family protein [Lentisphaeria bacterium]
MSSLEKNRTGGPASGLADRPEAPDKPKAGRPRWWQRWWVRFVAVFLVVVIVLGIVARLVLPGVLVSVGNRKLSKHFAAPAALEDIDLGLLQCRFTVQDLRLNQPDGFGGDLFLNLPEARVNLALSSLFGSPLIVEEVMVADLSIHVVRDKDGTLNVVRLLQPTAPEAVTEPAKPPSPIHIKRITAKNMTLHYTDSALDQTPVHITLKGCDVLVTDLYLNMAAVEDSLLPGRAEMTGRLVQPATSNAPLGIIARFGPVGTGRPIPAGRAALRLAGLELQSWYEFLPQGVPQTIGGDIADINLDVAILSDTLDCTIAIVTPAGDALKLHVGGTPRRPLVDPNGVQGMVAERAREAGWNTLGNMGDTGEELGRTALSSIAAAGKGAGTTVWGTVTGLFKTASSVSKGDMAGGGKDLLDTMQTSVTDAADTVGDSGASLTTGIMQTASAVGGGDRNELWRSDTQQRWARSWAQARRSVEASSIHGNEMK